MKLAYLSLGSNMGARERMLEAAAGELSGPQIRLLRRSPIYETEPQGYRDQPWFLNQAIEIETDLFPLQLLNRAMKIERKLRRKRTVANGPRTLDIDIIFYGKAVVRSEKLQIPHPRYAERRFVLQPMVDLAPDWRDPVTNRTMRELLAACPRQAMRLWQGSAAE